MLKCARMQKVRIMGIKELAPSVLQQLQQLGVVEITQLKRDYLESGKPLEIAGELSEQLTRIRGMKNSLVPIDFRASETLGAREAIEEAKKIGIDRKLVEMNDASETIKKRKIEIGEELKLLNLIKHLNIDYSRLDRQYLDFRLGKVKADRYHRLVATLSNATRYFEVMHSPSGQEYLVLFAIKKGEHVTEALERGGFSEILLPNISTTPQGQIELLSKELEGIRKQEESLKAALKKISYEYWPKVAVLNEALKIELERAESAARLGVTSMSFVLEGWVLEKQYAHLEKALRHRFPKLVVEKAQNTQDAPILLENPRPVRPFEFLVEFFSLPRYGELEPSAVLALTFPLVYGMMVGDVGYGFISLGLAALIMMKMKSGMLNSVARMWALAAIPSIIFGLFFDEWFGFSFKHFMEFFGIEVHGHLLSLLGLNIGLHRLEQMEQLIAFTILVGVLHLSIGLFIGFLNEKGHNLKHALAKIGWIGVMLGGLLLIPNLLFNATVIPVAFDQVLVGALVFVAS
ncbi:hypothetical protein FJZ26_04240, partial [Candidatus Parvarchaeota archaeon]|nr:hypothetical protein [Candidatus Parvarchaeota archaeon]